MKNWEQISGWVFKTFEAFKVCRRIKDEEIVLIGNDNCKKMDLNNNS